MSSFVADFGGTRVKAGIIQSGELIDSFVIDVPNNPLMSEQLQVLKDAFLARLESVREGVSGFACSLPCIVEPSESKVTRVFGKYDDVLHFSIPEWSQQELGIPTVIENDARAAAVGEWQMGAGRGCDDLVMVTLGTGIGTAVISGGKPLYGNSGLAGNLGGHNIFHPGGRPCVCGLAGCIEAYVSTWALPVRAKESILFKDSALANEEIIDYRAVFQLAKKGDDLATELRNQALEYWGALLVNLIYQYDPQCIVLGGGIMAAKDEIIPALTQTISQQLTEQTLPILKSAELGDQAALFGLDHLRQKLST